MIVQSVETMFMHTVFEEIERASAHFTTTGAEVLVRPLEGVDAQQQLDVIDELLEAACRASRFLRRRMSGCAPVFGAVRRMPVVTFNSDLPDSGPPVLRRRGQFRVRTHERRFDGPGCSPVKGKSCWLPVRKTTGRISSVWTAFRPRLPQIFPV